ncbi:DNA polymerase III subunit delta' [Iodobacter sp. CM08]|uniref:DNA polymerase III subunit delta' n=1 Tax=Iodobacter sp. CM08 TaxID=3085902 RepID=UPI002982AACC|nr:DNA polymerase III subunit delta' [Iodobacter sp. CM08]MDW5416020.1 DNA polymerase III subunit delta' [Iodobacter sp. CM08]
MKTLYPWQAAAWSQLMREMDRLPHAMLITGEEGIGKRRFAEYLAQFLLCEDETKTTAPCGVCDGCRWYMAGNHPDYRVLSPEDNENDASEDAKPKRKSQVIGVDDIRDLADFVNLTAHRKGIRVTVVYPAETLNVAAANAFLKTLEEPPSGAMFILVSNHWRRLLPTIRSRCRVFPMATPEHATAAAWLAQQQVVNPALHLAHTGGAPLAALEDASAEWLPNRKAFLAHIANPAVLDVLAVASELEKAKLEMSLVVGWLQKWVHDLINIKMTGKLRYYPDWESDLQRLAAQSPAFFHYTDRLNEAMRLAHHPLNQRLVFESLLFAYLDALRSNKGKK